MNNEYKIAKIEEDYQNLKKEFDSIKNSIENLKNADTRQENQLNNIDKRMDRFENEFNNKLNDIRDIQKKLKEETIPNEFEKISQKITDLKNESVYAKGFIKAILLLGGVIAFTITVASKFIHNL